MTSRDTGGDGDGTSEWAAAVDALSLELAIYEGVAIREVNRAYAAATGIDRALLPGLPCHVARFARDAPCPGCPLAAGGEAAEADVHARGSTFRVRGFRLARAEHPDAWVVSYRDVSRERQLESNREETERLAAVDRLAGGIAHEINNPMAFVSSSLRTLREHVRDLTSIASIGTLAADLAAAGRGRAALKALARMSQQAAELDVRSVAEDAQLVLDEAEAGAGRVARIVQALQGLGRDELGDGEPVELAVVVARALDRARRDGAPFPKVAWACRDPVHVFGRPLQLDRAFYEIARNAGQAIGSRDGTVRVSCRAHGDLALVEIADNGVGIPAADRSRVFEPFFTTRGVGGGIGLGLTVARSMVRSHGGAIEVASEPGKGTKVRVAFPSTSPGSLGDDSEHP